MNAKFRAFLTGAIALWAGKPAAADADPAQAATQLNAWFWRIAGLWTLLILLLATWRCTSDQTAAWLMAKNLAQESYQKDILYRRWATQHGGIYVPMTEQTPPNPYLDLPERDVTTSSGLRLTLINPAYMNRQVHELGVASYGIQGHITSLHPLRPDNAPDPWERQALEAFDQGQGEAISLEPLHGETHLRFMRPMATEPGCVKCHATQLDQDGQLHAGLSVSIPWRPYREAMLRQWLATGVGYGTAWGVGLLGMLWIRRRLRDHLTERQDREAELQAEETRFHDLATLASDWFWEQDDQFRFTYLSTGGAVHNLERAGIDPATLIGKTRWEIAIDLTPEQCAAHRTLLDANQPFRDLEYPIHARSGEARWFNISGMPRYDVEGRFMGYRGTGRDITERRRLEETLSSRIVALTRPLDQDCGIEFADLLNLEEIQQLQDLFAQATGVASIITRPDGVPITRPSNFCRLCETLIRNTEKGASNCYRSDAVIGRHNPNGPMIQPCLSGGLWDAGASITVGGRHIANWLIGQVRDETQSEARMAEYAREIGVEEQAFLEAFYEVPIMPREQFQRVAEALFALARQLSTLAYQNVQQARFIADRQRADEDRQQAEQRSERLAYYDPLTELPNRNLLTQRAKQALALAARRSAPLAVLFLDLDRFKEVNDSLGHTAGDALLVETAQRLRDLIRDADTASRQGGDEFVLLLPETDLDGARQVADKLLATFRQPFVIASHRLRVTLSVGIALYPDDGASFDELLQNADTALYRAKQDGRDTHVRYAREMNIAGAARLVLEAELRQAIETGQLQAYYQPKVRLADGVLVGAEALVRWQHPERGLIPPNHFIPVAEASDLIVALGDWMLAEVCRQLAAWRDAGLPFLAVAVNLAARHFRQSNCAPRIESLLAAHHLPFEALELELTESTLLETGVQTLATLRTLHGLGIGLAIDDFGTGYSSLGYLKRLPITALKIDQSFVRDLEIDPDSRTLAKTIVALGHGLGLTVVAEGVETEIQRRILLEQGCDLAQGYLFSKPLPAEEFVAWQTGQRVVIQEMQADPNRWFPPLIEVAPWGP